MTINDRGTEPESDLESAIERALEAANLRGGDSLGAPAASVLEEREPSAAEAGDVAAGFDGD